ncbi:cell division protein FtsA [Candidatus Sumerlaeota bacterium]|nr:cell division protein FtsA [Candidatus Sumerlaeota bacterium]
MAAKRRKKARHVIGLDVGTTKVCAIIGEEAQGGRNILGLGTTPSLGIKKGIVIDVDQTVASIAKAVEKASRMAGVEGQDLIVGIAGGHIECHSSSASLEIVNPERGVTRNDIARVTERAKALSLPVDREILHLIPQEYVIDSGPVKNPLGQVSKTLEVNVHVVTAALTAVQNLIRCVKQSGLNTTDILLQSIASAQAILEEEEKELGVLLLDIGGGTTDVAIINGGHIRYSGVIPFGGDNLTKDIAQGLKISLFDAENVKKKYGCAMTSLARPEENFTVAQVVNHKKITVRRQKLADITEARIEEIFNMVRDSIKASPFRDKFYAGVVLTGGASLLEGVCDLGEKIFECPCRMGAPHGLKGMTSVISSPIYSTGAGLVQHGFSDALNQPPNGSGLYDWTKNALIKILDFFK